MWQPNRRQWPIIWIVALLLALAWPPAAGRSLGVKAINWLADPTGALPSLPEPLPRGLDDNGDAVTAHDLELSEYYRTYESSPAARLRMDLKIATDPLAPATERQWLIALAVAAMLILWRLNPRNP